MTVFNVIQDTKDDVEILKSSCVEWDFQNPFTDALQFAKDMIETMYHYNGLGLAVNLVGKSWRVFVMRGTEKVGNFACFNPRIVNFSQEIILLEESCLSFPGVVVKIKRPRHVRLRFQTPDGQMHTNQFTGMTARVVQHE